MQFLGVYIPLVSISFSIFVSYRGILFYLLKGGYRLVDPDFGSKPEIGTLLWVVAGARAKAPHKARLV